MTPSGFGHVVSIGSACWTSQLIKDMGLKRYSCPFDWIFSSPGFVAHCLADDFAEFLSRDRWVSTGGPQHWTLPLIRDRYGLGQILNHHDVSNDGDFHYLVRSVARFRSVLAAPDPKIFLLISDTKNILHPEVDVLFDRLAAAASGFKLVSIGLEQHPAASPHVEQLKADERNDVYRLHPCSRIEDGLRFTDARDNQAMQEILGRYEIRPLPHPDASQEE